MSTVYPFQPVVSNLRKFVFCLENCLAWILEKKKCNRIKSKYDRIRSRLKGLSPEQNEELRDNILEFNQRTPEEDYETNNCYFGALNNHIQRRE